MSTVLPACPYCSDKTVVHRIGVSKANQRQRYICRGCNRSFQLEYAYAGYQPGIERTIAKMYYRGKSNPDIVAVTGVSAPKLAEVLKPHKGRRTGQVCPSCNAEQIWKFGKDRGIQRYRCKSCGKTFLDKPQA